MPIHKPLKFGAIPTAEDTAGVVIALAQRAGWLVDRRTNADSSSAGSMPLLNCWRGGEPGPLVLWVKTSKAVADARGRDGLAITQEPIADFIEKSGGEVWVVCEANLDAFAERLRSEPSS